MALSRRINLAGRRMNITTRRRPTVLCIDDDPAVTTAIKFALSEFDVDVKTAFFGDQGIWLAVTEAPAVIITDLRMPQGNGEYVIQCLLERHETCSIPIIVLTGCRQPETQRWMGTLGVAAYLRKPMDLHRLRSTLRQYVELRPIPGPNHGESLSS